MLKGKKALYILFPVVALIWGAIIVQVIGAFSDDDPIGLDTGGAIVISDITTKEREKFTLSTIERDPFLGTLYQPEKKVIKKLTTPKTKKTTISWPSITYKGVVSGQNSANAIYLIEINGTDELMTLKQTLSEVTLIKGLPNSVRLRYKGKTKDFKISN